MAFYESPRFPDGVARHFEGGPRFLTDIVVNAGGFESRNANWSQARGLWICSHVPKSAADTATLTAFFRATAAGRAHGWRFRDHADYSATTAEGIFVSLTATTFQMYKRYTSGGQTHDRIIKKPVSGTVSVTGGTSPSVDYTTGIVTVASGTPTAWSGEFDVPVRFDVDEMRASLVPESNPRLYVWGDIPIVELRIA